MAKSQTVRVTADPASVLNAFGATFSDTTTVLGELLQNGRRAGATKLVIECTDDRLTVSDDGCGITQFSKLLAMAQSGWDSPIREAEAPYGIGFLSTLWCCETLEVRSRGKRLYETTANLRSLCAVSTEPVPDDGKTHVILHGFRERAKIQERLPRLVAGFPIPVHYNGQPVARPHAMDALDTVNIGIGHYHHLALAPSNPHCYLQGLPIGATAPSRHRGLHREGVLHLDPTQVFGRMPDRACVRNREEVASAIDNAIRQHSLAELTRLLGQMGAQAFATHHLDTCRAWKAQELMAQCAAVPSDWLMQYAAFPRHVPEWDQSPLPSLSGAAILRDDLAAAPPVCLDYCEPGTAMTARYLCFKQKRRVLANFIPETHWLRTLAATLDDADVAVEATGLGGKVPIEIDGHFITVQMAASIRLVHATLGAVTLDADEGIFDGETLFVQPDCTGELVAQISAFVDENDSLEEERRDQDADELGLLIQRLNGAPIDETLRSYIHRGIPHNPPEELIGKRFVLTFHKNAFNRITFELEATPT